MREVAGADSSTGGKMFDCVQSTGRATLHASLGVFNPACGVIGDDGG